MITQLTDTEILERMFARHGETAVAAEIAAMTKSPGGFSVSGLKTRMNRIVCRLRRDRQKAERRERHGGDVVVYRGPLHVAAEKWQDLVDRTKSVITHNGRYVEIGRTNVVWRIFGVGVAEGGTKTITIPVGSRILMDTRRPIQTIMIAELVRCANGAHRLHFWAASRPRDDMAQVWPHLDDVEGSTNSGRVYESPRQPHVGIFAAAGLTYLLPLDC